MEIRDPSHSIIAHGSGLKTCPCGETASFFIETGGFGEAKDFDIIVVCKLYLLTLDRETSDNTNRLYKKRLINIHIQLYFFL